ncbi:MAG: molybdopterin-dependent oxidoreductase [Deferrisomatales bacterium]|nr:molybdopterin-dependent oxidoreductase [Deferrisomatales bacterium]
MSRLNRRQFLAAGTLGSAGLAWAGQEPLLQPWNAGKARSLKKSLDPVATVCVGCEARCPLLAYRDHGRVVQVAPNPAAGDDTSICARAYQQVEALYDPERLLRPLARVGSRGEGKWRVISWDEAVAQMRLALNAGVERAWVEVGRPDPLALPVLERLGVTNVVGARTRLAQARRDAEQSIYGAPLSRPRLGDVRTVLLVGASPWDNGSSFAPLAKALARAKVDGAEVLSVSSYQGATGSVASRWIPLRPDSEAVLLLGLARLALQDERVDAARLAGIVDGELEVLRQQLTPYTVERVGEECGVAADTLTDLANRWVGRTPGVCLAETSSADAHGPAQAAAALLNALAGSSHATGAGVRAAKANSGLPQAESERAHDDATAAVLSPSPIPFYLAYRANPVYRGPAELAAAFADERRVGFLVCLDTHLTETARQADLVLPAAADLELWNLFGSCAGDGSSLVSLQRPAPRAVSEGAWLRAQQTPAAALFDGPGTGPLGEARQLGDVLLDLLGNTDSATRRMVPHAGVAEYVRERAEELGLGPSAPGVLRESSSPPQGTACWFSTPSRKLEVAGKLSLAATGAPATAADGHSFALVVLDHPELDPAFANTRWGREARRTNPLYIHTRVAEQLGLTKGSTAVVSGAGREIEVQVQPVEGIHPDAVALAGDFGHWAGGMAATASDQPEAPPAPMGAGSRRELLANPLALAAPAPQPAQVPWWHGSGAGVRVGQLGGEDKGLLRVAVRPA